MGWAICNPQVVVVGHVTTLKALTGSVPRGDVGFFIGLPIFLIGLLPDSCWVDGGMGIVGLDPQCSPFIVAFCDPLGHSLAGDYGLASFPFNTSLHSILHISLTYVLYVLLRSPLVSADAGQGCM